MKDINATVIVDLKPEEQELLKNIHKDARWGINRAKREGLIVEAGNKKDWEEFYEIYKKTVVLGGTNPESLEKLKAKTRVFLVCKDKDKIIAGAGIYFADMYNQNIPRLNFNASLLEYQKLQPNNLLYWNCIMWAKENKFEKFDLGGYQIKARGHLMGINKFKEKWGEIIYYKKDYPIIKALGRKLIRNSNLFWNINKKLRGRK
tara:strand:+ start:1831 stop:2442 length:612 start_codon:yes stop_codon:yes gene_type:complete